MQRYQIGWMVALIFTCHAKLREIEGEEQYRMPYAATLKPVRINGVIYSHDDRNRNVKISLS